MSLGMMAAWWPWRGGPAVATPAEIAKELSDLDVQRKQRREREDAERVATVGDRLNPVQRSLILDLRDRLKGRFERFEVLRVEAERLVAEYEAAWAALADVRWTSWLAAHHRWVLTYGPASEAMKVRYQEARAIREDVEAAQERVRLEAPLKDNPNYGEDDYRYPSRHQQSARVSSWDRRDWEPALALVLGAVPPLPGHEESGFETPAEKFEKLWKQRLALTALTLGQAPR
jgi:hypothetical protein